MYADRTAAGEALGAALLRRLGPAGPVPDPSAPSRDVVVLALPRGGVPVGAAVAALLRCPLDVVVARKLGAPHHPELAMGAIARFGGPIHVVRNDGVIARMHIDGTSIERVVRRETVELHRREALYREGRQPIDVSARTAIVVDDGLATGATMRAAVAAVAGAAGVPNAIVVAAPIGAADTCAELSALPHVTDVACPWQPAGFSAVGQGYADFDQTADAEVIHSLRTQPDR